MFRWLALALLALALTAPAATAADPVQRSLRELVREDGYPGALAAVRDRDGRTRHYTAGVGDLRTRAKVPVDGEVRIGSNTKPYTAVVVLQLVAEGKVDLEASVDTYLPGLLRGDGIDGRDITVRQLLQHRTGLPNYTAVLAETGFLPTQHVYMEPRALLDLALAREADFAPGAKWEYSNTNYVVAGLIAEKVTGRPIGEEIERRVIDRIGLRRTYFPGLGEQRLRGPHPHGYHHDDLDAPFTDVTVLDPSWGWAAGQMVSTPSEVNRFFRALMNGELLPREQMRQMRSTVPAPEFGKGAGYGLGLVRTKLPCGGAAWGHGGTIPGYNTVNAVTSDGRAATIATTALPESEAHVEHLQRALDRALCG